MKGGLSDALKGLSGNAWDKQPAVPVSAAADSEIELDLIDPDPDQPRKEFDADRLEELAESIKEHGLQQPIGLRPNPNAPDRYVIKFGERRWRAFKLLGYKSIPAIVRDTSNVAVEALIENLQREDLTPGEIARALARYADETKKKGTEIAKQLGKSNAWVSQYLAVMKMPPDFVAVLESGAVNDVSTLNEAFKLYRTYPEDVTKLIHGASADKPVSRDSIRKLAAKLKGEDARPKGGKAKTPEPDAEGDSNASQDDSTGAASPTPSATALPRVFVLDEEGEEIGYLDLSEPTNEGAVRVIRDGNGLSTREQLATLRIARVELPG